MGRKSYGPLGAKGMSFRSLKGNEMVNAIVTIPNADLPLTPDLLPQPSQIPPRLYRDLEFR